MQTNTSIWFLSSLIYIYIYIYIKRKELQFASQNHKRNMALMGRTNERWIAWNVMAAWICWYFLVLISLFTFWYLTLCERAIYWAKWILFIITGCGKNILTFFRFEVGKLPGSAMAANQRDWTQLRYLDIIYYTTWKG